MEDNEISVNTENKEIKRLNRIAGLTSAGISLFALFVITFLHVALRTGLIPSTEEATFHLFMISVIVIHRKEF